MAKNYFNRYVWLVDLIHRHGHISFPEISSAWQHSALNESGERLPERTFFNHKEAIADIFGLEIKNDRSLGFYIANSEDIEEDSAKKWLLESLSMNNLMNESADMRDRILFEKVPSSRSWLPVIVGAMRDGNAIELTYQSFWKSEPNTFVVHPYCLKLFKQRWYLLARSETYDYPCLYALDRIHNITLTKQTLELPKGFNASEFFSKYYGVIVDKDPNIAPSEVLLRVAANQVKYFESLPLHHTQEKVEENAEWTVFRYRLIPTFDFKQEILSRGATVKVLEPAWFQDEMCQEVADMAARYGLATRRLGAGDDILPYFSEEELDM